MLLKINLLLLLNHILYCNCLTVDPNNLETTTTEWIGTEHPISSSEQPIYKSNNIEDKLDEIISRLDKIENRNLKMEHDIQIYINSTVERSHNLLKSINYSLNEIKESVSDVNKSMNYITEPIKKFFIKSQLNDEDIPSGMNAILQESLQGTSIHFQDIAEDLSRNFSTFIQEMKDQHSFLHTSLINLTTSCDKATQVNSSISSKENGQFHLIDIENQLEDFSTMLHMIAKRQQMLSVGQDRRLFTALQKTSIKQQMQQDQIKSFLSLTVKNIHNDIWNSSLNLENTFMKLSNDLIRPIDDMKQAINELNDTLTLSNNELLDAINYNPNDLDMIMYGTIKPPEYFKTNIFDTDKPLTTTINYPDEQTVTPLDISSSPAPHTIHNLAENSIFSSNEILTSTSTKLPQTSSTEYYITETTENPNVMFNESEMFTPEPIIDIVNTSYVKQLNKISQILTTLSPENITENIRINTSKLILQNLKENTTIDLSLLIDKNNQEIIKPNLTGSINTSDIDFYLYKNTNESGYQNEAEVNDTDLIHSLHEENMKYKVPERAAESIKPRIEIVPNEISRQSNEINIFTRDNEIKTNEIAHEPIVSSCSSDIVSLYFIIFPIIYL